MNERTIASLNILLRKYFSLERKTSLNQTNFNPEHSYLVNFLARMYFRQKDTT